MVCIHDITEGEALHKFIHGLKADIKSRILVANPSDINEAMQYAQSLDDVLHPRNPYLRRPQHSGRSYFRRDGTVPMDLDAIEEVEDAEEDEEDFDDLSAVQAQKMRRFKRGKCHNCGKPGHWANDCPNRKSQSAQAAYNRPKQKHHHCKRNSVQ